MFLWGPILKSKIKYLYIFMGVLCRLWGTFLADVVIQMLGTDYARILRAIYAFAQVKHYDIFFNKRKEEYVLVFIGCIFVYICFASLGCSSLLLTSSKTVFTFLFSLLNQFFYFLKKCYNAFIYFCSRIVTTRDLGCKSKAIDLINLTK